MNKNFVEECERVVNKNEQIHVIVLNENEQDCLIVLHNFKVKGPFIGAGLDSFQEVVDQFAKVL